MTCARCHGLMVEDHLLDIQNPSGELWIRAWRCINCGELVEPMIDLNRRAGSRAQERRTASQAA